MYEFLQDLLLVFRLIVSGWFAYMSSVLVSEKKARYKAGTHDYYDNPIKDYKKVKSGLPAGLHIESGWADEERAKQKDND